MLKRTVNAGLRLVGRSPVGTAAYRLGAMVHELWLRTASIAKAAALFPHAVNLSLDVRCQVKYPENVVLGRDVVIGADCVIGALACVRLGDHVRLSRGVVIESAGLDRSGGLPYRHIAAPIDIGAGVWLGSGAIVLAGVRIGERAIIGAGVVVSKDVPAFAVVVGASNRVLERSRENP